MQSVKHRNFLQRLARFFDLSFAFMKANFHAHHSSWGKTLYLAFFMLVQNALFMAIWVVFFANISSVKGWGLREIALLYGIISCATGLALFFCDGARQIARLALTGELDGYLARPGHPLLSILFSRSNASSLGDIFSGPLFWFGLAHVSLGEFVFLLFLSALTACLTLAVIVSFFCLAFWVKNGSRLCDQLFETLIIFSAIPQKGQALGLKFLMYSILPAGFLATIPVDLAQHFSWGWLGVLILATLAYGFAALKIFDAGVRKYIS